MNVTGTEGHVPNTLTYDFVNINSIGKELLLSKSLRFAIPTKDVQYKNLKLYSELLFRDCKSEVSRK